MYLHSGDFHDRSLGAVQSCTLENAIFVIEPRVHSLKELSTILVM